METYLVSKKYNSPQKFKKALEEGNLKYVKSLIKRGKVIVINSKTKT